jgi:hypothetical protein
LSHTSRPKQALLKSSWNRYWLIPDTSRNSHGNRVFQVITIAAEDVTIRGHEQR